MSKMIAGFSPAIFTASLVVASQLPGFCEAIQKGSVTETLPPTAGRILTSPQQKAQAAHEAESIKEDTPGEIPDIAKKTEVHRPTIALALGGGGSRGAAHIGVLKVFQREHIPVDYIVGNSMGSIVGGLYAAGVPLDDIKTMLGDGSLRLAYGPRFLPPKVLAEGLGRVAHKKSYAGIISGKKYQAFLESRLPEPNMQVEDCLIPFSAVAANLVDGKAYRINTGDLATALRASSSLSPLLKPVEIGDKLYFDGGIRANLPALAAKETGADIVIAVLVDEPLRVMPKEAFIHYSKVASRLTDIIMAVSDEHQLQFADIVINPDVSGISMLSRKLKTMKNDVERAEEAGEKAAEKALPEIRKRLNPTVALDQH